MAISKNDQNARFVYGSECYDSVPKSVFALVAYYFAQRCGDGEGSELGTILLEIEALGLNGIIDPAQAKRAIAALIRELSHAR